MDITQSNSFANSTVITIQYKVSRITSNSSSKTCGAAALHSNYLDVFLRFRRTFAEVITFGGASAHEFYSIRSKSAIFISRNINYNINSLLLLRVRAHIIHIIYIHIGRALHTRSRNENNIGAATGNP